MKTLNVLQGSPEWIAARANCRTASEAPAMVGASKYQSRTELLHAKKTGIATEIDAHTQRRFDDGHAAEAAARPIAEEIIGDDLFPVTATDDEGWLLASYDGITMGREIAFEHKLWNEALAENVRNGVIEPHFYWQLEQQILVSGCKKVLFMVSDGTKEKCVYCWYEAVPGRAEQLIAGWKQFDIDLAAYVPQEQKAAVVAAPVETLPAITYKLNGLALTSNLVEFKAAAEMLIDRSKAPLETDQDFADRDALCKAFGEAEKRCELLRSQVLGEIKDVDEFSRGLSDIQAAFRAARLAGEKLVEAEKKNRRLVIQQNAEQALRTHIASLNARISPVVLPHYSADFAGAMKGKKTIASLQDACDTLLAQSKVEASAYADEAQSNLDALKELATGFEFLFADLQQIVFKASDDFALLVKSRIANHKEREEQRFEAERERIRQEEARKLEQQSQAAQPAAVAPVITPAVTQQAAAPAQKSLNEEFAMPAVDTGERIKLGDINARLAPLSITVEGLASFGFHHVGTDRAAKLYNASDFPRICAALIAHLSSIQVVKVAA